MLNFVQSCNLSLVRVQVLTFDGISFRVWLSTALLTGMEGSRDFLPLLNHDLSLKIFSYLDEPADVVRASSVSHSWRTFVIANGVSKSLCLRWCPETPCAIKAIEEDNIIEPLKVETNGNVGMEKLKKNHRVYAFLARGVDYYVTNDCISEAICASTTDNFLEENIRNTLVLNRGASYWSSARESNPDLPEMLTYKLVPELRFITKIRVQLNQASVKAVRFRMGHFRTPERETDLVGDYEARPRSIEDHVVWTYTSEKFPVLQVCLVIHEMHQPLSFIHYGNGMRVNLRQIVLIKKKKKN
ncbi:hypothetical protein MKW92_042250 [Papaver armeniacum]|nr:hypothetical protein MKW92_042250 [Papaver armeniacum]